MTRKQIKYQNEILKEIEKEEQEQNLVERIKLMLDSAYYQGFCDNLSANEWKFYFEEYKDFV